MIPMISSMEEILWVKEKLAEAKQQLRNEHIPFDEKIQLGIMLEVPSVSSSSINAAKRLISLVLVVMT
ncbi:multiphosphoryl transfer protein 2 [includes phosphoenolpyruvate-protein phosphotransferase);phosphocarrier protein Hpr; fructose-like specific PTS system EIIA component] [Escherichia coli]|uniref:Multiphosphoryl transfer protein 2 [includes phosphoenolpyruvate-protein phosphotransferasephosphocarrier protein Hpr fructose-like specific PTS system EIIA component] n=1 Tax=Escherichia coli TaxID=562 RepID=A0A377BMN9_ECOLX|nr:multiphosphoryl transfer protein 2 [includes phosphoenolpyruvate-protein phosphotransferase);phosphocarrier protein Hpr; fructose-like specific PTS system EIIA component] [Escherichia coli]